METTSSVRWDSSQGIFEVSSNDGRSVCTVTSPFSGTALPKFPVLGALYDHPELPEAHVIALRNGGTSPVGYLLRIGAAFSDDAGTTNSAPWFKGVAVSAAHWALQHASQDQMAAYDGNNVAPDELFPDANCVLVLQRRESQVAGLLDLSQLDAQLFSLGFRRIVRNPRLAWLPGRHALERLRTLGADLKLSFLPNATRYSTFLSEVLITHIPEATLPLARFFFFYQLVELLIEELAEQSVRESLIRLSSFRGGWDSVELHSEARTIQSSLNNATRLARLFSLPGTNGAEFAALRDTALKALALPVGAGSQTTAEALYGLRNQLFHNYRGSANRVEPFLRDVNELLEVVLPDLIRTVLVKKSHVVTALNCEAISDVLDSLILNSGPAHSG